MPTYKLQEDSIQYGFQQSRAKMQVFGGGFANGKTTALVVKCLRLARDYPGSNGLIARSTYPKLNDTIRKVFLEWCPAHWIKRRPTQDDNTCYLVNGTVVNFRYIAQRGKNTESGDSTSNLLSATYDWIAVDQVEDPEIQEKDLLDLLGRLRGQTPYRPEQGSDDESMPSSGPRWIMLALNPTRNWFYKKIIQPYHVFKQRGIYLPSLMIDADTKLPIMELYEGDTYTNKSNLTADFLSTLEAAYKGSMRKRFLLGQWAAYEGLVHPEFDPLVHMLTKEQILVHLHSCKERHVNLEPIEMYDFGLTAPSCYMLGAIDDFGRIFILDGFYEPDFSYEDQPDRICEIRERYFQYLRFKDAVIRSDPAIFKRIIVRKQETGDTVAKLLMQQPAAIHGKLKFVPGNNAVAPGIAKINAYLAMHPKFPHPLTGLKPSPVLYFSEELAFLEDEIGSYRWRKNPQGNRIDEPVDDNDHAMTALKYGLSKRPLPSKIRIPSELLPPKWMFWQESEERV